MMKTLFKYLTAVALALVLFVPANKAFSDESFPPGVSFSHVVGAVLDPAVSTLNQTTLDAVDFGFWTRYVRICLRADSEDSYFRLATTAAYTSAPTDTTFMTVPASTSAVFILGELESNPAVASSFDWGAIPMSAPTVSASGAADGRVYPATFACTTQPWRTRGLVMHIASGLATADVWGYK